MFVAASTACYAELALAEAVERLADLSFGALEITIHEGSPQLTPEFVTAELEKSIAICAHTNRMDVIAYDVIFAAEGEAYTVISLCDNVEGLGITLDPSHYICGPYDERSCEKLMKYVSHIRLRDSTEQDMQVRVGQGIIESGRLVNQ